jgi:hypothetical protein
VASKLFAACTRSGPVAHVRSDTSGMQVCFPVKMNLHVTKERPTHEFNPDTLEHLLGDKGAGRRLQDVKLVVRFYIQACRANVYSEPIMSDWPGSLPVTETCQIIDTAEQQTSVPHQPVPTATAASPPRAPRASKRQHNDPPAPPTRISRPRGEGKRTASMFDIKSFTVMS